MKSVEGGAHGGARVEQALFPMDWRALRPAPVCVCPARQRDAANCCSERDQNDLRAWLARRIRRA